MTRMLTAEEVKKRAKSFGADLVGIAPIERFEGAPLQMDPKQIMPEARSVIVMAFRVMRGSLRGIEEGTFFSNYSSMGYGGITYLYMPLTVINLSRFIEDHGYEAIPIGHQSDWRAIDNVGNLKRNFSRPVAPGRAHPDVMIHLRIAAALAGLGEIGYSKVFLTTIRSPATPGCGPHRGRARTRSHLPGTTALQSLHGLCPGVSRFCHQCHGCVRACMISLEKRGVLENKFKMPFRRRKPWLVDWSQPEEPSIDKGSENKSEAD